MDLRMENRLIAKGLVVAGLDEVGRGAWAGPLVAGCVAVNRKIALRSKLGPFLKQIRDSKQLTPKQREALFYFITSNFAWSVGVVNNKEIDSLGLGEANKLAFRRAVSKLDIEPNYLLIDYINNINLPLKTRGVKGGDGKVLSIAAASIVAKVYRDRLMIKEHGRLNKWDFDLHKGYGTKLHQYNLTKYGVSRIHRTSFIPVKRAM